MRIGFDVKDGVAYLTEWYEDACPEITLTVVGCKAIAVRIGKSTLKITDGVGRVKFSELKEGTYTPVLTTVDECISLAGLTLSRGVLSLSGAPCELARANRAYLLLAEAVRGNSEEIEKLKLQIYGKGIL